LPLLLCSRAHRTYLGVRLLAPHWQPHGMSLSPISSCILQPRDISQYLPAQVILDFHLRERGIDFEYLFGLQLANSANVVEMVFGEEAG
jgi:hypothetical protein